MPGGERRPPVGPGRRRALAMAGAMLLTFGLAPTATSPAFGATVPNPYVDQGTGELRIGALIVFGDSYSARRSAFPHWPYQMAGADGPVARLENFAKPGATAAGTGNNSFAGQVERWLADAPGLGDHDLTVVYFGYNDISKDELDVAERDFTAQLERLIAQGATGGERRLLIVIPHDRGGSPNRVEEGTSVATRQRTLAWRSFLQRTANAHPHVIAVDLTTAVDRVVADPPRYGFTDVTGQDEAASRTTVLYFDGGHFGLHGEQLVRQLIEYYLTRGWDWANQLPAGDRATLRLERDIEDGRAFPVVTASPRAARFTP